MGKGQYSNHNSYRYDLISCFSFFFAIFLLANLMPMVLLISVVPVRDQQLSDIDAGTGDVNPCTIIDVADPSPKCINEHTYCHFAVKYTFDIDGNNNSAIISSQDVLYSDDNTPNNYKPIDSIKSCWSHDPYHDRIVVWQRQNIDSNVKGVFIISVIAALLFNGVLVIFLALIYNRVRN